MSVCLICLQKSIWEQLNVPNFKAAPNGKFSPQKLILNLIIMKFVSPPSDSLFAVSSENIEMHDYTHPKIL